jgi:chorismate synthase
MNGFGHAFRVTTWGESHGPALGCVLDGLPGGFCVDLDAVQRQLDRRRPGQSALTTPRGETDRIRVRAGLFEGRTTGAPLALEVENHDARPEAYEHLRELYRPSHADFTWDRKFGHRDWRGGGRSSARETVARVAAGAVAEQLLAAIRGIEIVAWVSNVAAISSSVDPATVGRSDVDASDVRCPDQAAAADMRAEILAAREVGDTVGGCIRCVVRNPGVGLGEPTFSRIEAELARAMLSLPATKGFEIGSGFAGTRLRGSAHNDAMRADGNAVSFATNHAGGTLGGISSGAPIEFRVAFKPVATHFQPQQTVNTRGEEISFTASGRHDPCVLPRAVPMVEAMTALVLIDLLWTELARAAAQAAIAPRQP